MHPRKKNDIILNHAAGLMGLNLFFALILMNYHGNSAGTIKGYIIIPTPFPFFSKSFSFITNILCKKKKRKEKKPVTHKGIFKGNKQFINIRHFIYLPFIYAEVLPFQLI